MLPHGVALATSATLSFSGEGWGLRSQGLQRVTRALGSRNDGDTNMVHSIQQCCLVAGVCSGSRLKV